LSWWSWENVVGRRRKWILGIAGVSVLLVCNAIVKVHRFGVMHKPEVYLTEQRATELASFAEKLLKETGRTRLELLCIPRWWRPPEISADPPLTNEQVRATEKVLRQNHLHRIALAGQPRRVTYGYAALRTWCFYIYVSDPDIVPPKWPCRTIRKVRDNWYFGTF
jgi:hypothetical protein